MASAPQNSQLNVEACTRLVNSIWDWDASMRMFHSPVTDATVPGYSAIITDPIDLTTMREKLEAAVSGKQPSSSSSPSASSSSSPIAAADKAYVCDTDVVNDIDLMISNALKFNPVGSVWHAHAKELKKRLMKDFVPASGVVVDEEELVYIDSGSKNEAADYSKSLRKEEKKHSENIKDVLSGMQADLEIPIEELRKRFAAASAAPAKKSSSSGKKRAREEESSSSSSSGSSEDEEDSDDEEEEEEGEEDEEDSSSSSGVSA